MRDKVASAALNMIERGGLIIILIATLFAGFGEIRHMFTVGQASVTDLLLLFMYLEIVSMVAVYWRAGKLPVRMPLYVAMVGLARHLIVDQQIEAMELLSTSFGILLLAFAVLVVRYGHLKFPYEDKFEPRNFS